MFARLRRLSRRQLALPNALRPTPSSAASYNYLFNSLGINTCGCDDSKELQTLHNQHLQKTPGGVVVIVNRPSLGVRQPCLPASVLLLALAPLVECSFLTLCHLCLCV